MTASVVVIVPALLPLLTILVHPEHDPRDRAALRVMHTDQSVGPWVPITGKRLAQEHHRLHTGVVGWRVQRFAELLQVFNGEVR